MLNEFKSTLTKVIHLRSIIGYNSLVFALKKTPVIGKILPDALYRTKFLKVIYWIFHVILEVLKLFIGKFAGLGLIYLVTAFLTKEYMEFGKGAGMTESTLFGCFALSFFILYALFGILINRPVFKCTTEKEYLVFMLRMNARKLNNTLFIYELGKLFIGYLITGLVAALFGAPLPVCLGIPVLAVLIKIFGTGAQAAVYKLKNKHHKPMKTNGTLYLITVVLVLMIMPLVLVFIANGHYVPLPILLAASALLAALGVWGFFVLKGFGSDLHRRALRDNIVRTEVSKYKETDTTKSFKKIKANGTVKGDKKGFEYLNALFIKRHGRMLIVKPVIFTVCLMVIMGLLIFEFVYGYYTRFGGDNCLAMVGSNLINLITFGHYEDALLPFESDSAVLFFRFLVQYHLLGLLIPVSIADNSFKSTQAMFINCDNSLMTFSFFKQRDKIIKLFDIRLKQLIKINIAPSVAMGVFADLILFYTGGQDYPFQYLLTIVICILMSAIYAAVWLTLYYLFQPFTTSVNIKGGAYRIAWIILSIVFCIVCWIPAHSAILAAVLLVFTAVFIYFMRKLVYKHAPKTWRVRV